jgi:hypothetical protein
MKEAKTISAILIYVLICFWGQLTQAQHNNNLHQQSTKQTNYGLYLSHQQMNLNQQRGRIFRRQQFGSNNPNRGQRHRNWHRGRHQQGNCCGNGCFLPQIQINF